MSVDKRQLTRYVVIYDAGGTVYKFTNKRDAEKKFTDLALIYPQQRSPEYSPRLLTVDEYMRSKGL